MRKCEKLIGILTILLILIITSKSYITYADNEPRLVIDSYTIIDGRPVSGGQTTLSLVLKNLSIDKSVSNILLTYQNTYSEAIYPIDGDSNQVYTSEISANSEYKVDIPICIVNEYKSKTAPITITLKYEDSDENSYTNNTEIYLPILQKDELVINGLTVAKKGMKNDEALINFNYGNNTINDLYSVTMYIDGKISEDQKKVELGDLKVDEYKTFEYNVNLQTEGDQTINIRFTYNDGKGNAYSIDKGKYDITSSEKSTLKTDQTSKRDKFVDLNLSIWKLCIINCALIILVILIDKLFKKVGKRKKYV